MYLGTYFTLLSLQKLSSVGNINYFVDIYLHFFYYEIKRRTTVNELQFFLLRFSQPTLVEIGIVQCSQNCPNSMLIG